MVEVRVSQAALLSEIDAQEVRTSQAALLVEVDAQFVRTSQAALLVEIDQIQIRTSQAVLLVEIEDRRVWPGFESPSAQSGRAGEGERATPQSALRTPQSLPAPIAARAAQAAGEAFAALAASRATFAPGTVLPTGLAGPLASGEGGGVSEVRAVSVVVAVDWDRDGTFTDESANVIGVQGSSSLMAPQQALSSGRGMVDRCTVTLHNKSYRYSTLNADSPLAASIGEGALQAAPIRVSVTIGATTTRIFTGVIRSMQEDAPTPTQAAQVTLDCRSRDDLLLQQRYSTPLADWLASSTAGRTEDAHIVEILEAGGLVDGTDFISPAYAVANSVNRSIDPGIFPLQYVWLDDESPLEEIWQLAAACCGWFYSDADGLLHYHNLAGLLDEMMAQHYGSLTEIDITEENSARLSLAWRDNELLSDVTVEAQALEQGPESVIWQTEAPTILEPGQTKTIYARYNQPVTAATSLTWSAASAGGGDLTASVTLAATAYAQRMKLMWENTGSKTAYITAELTGVALLRSDAIETTVSVDGADTFWADRPARSKTIRGNLYVQSEAQANTVARYVLDRSKRPLLVASITNLDDPGVRVGRRCAVRYPGVQDAGTEFAGLVMSSSWRADKGGFRQSVEVFDVTRLFVDSEPFFVLGVNRLGDEDDPDEANLFY